MVLRLKNNRVNSFGYIADRYATTKPIRGTDIIPIGDRRYKWERIIKRSDTHYDMVLDETMFYYTNSNSKPITLVSWEMKNDIEVVTIYNDGSTTSYTFLDNLLPHDLRFFVWESTGRQYISMNWGSKKKYEYDWAIADQGDKDFYLPKDMNKPLQFARKHSKWQHVGTEYIFRHAMTQVNKDAKADIKPHSDKFYEWVITMQGMLPCDDWQYSRDMSFDLNNYMVMNNVQGYEENAEEYKNIMRDENHPMRLHLAVEWLSNSPLFGYSGRQTIETKEQASKVRASWNRWVNKTLGLTNNIHEARTEEVK